MLIQEVIDQGEKLELESITIQSVENNCWAKKTYDALKESIYDNMTFQEAIRLQDGTLKNKLNEMIKSKMFIGEFDIHLLPHTGLLMYNVNAKKLKFKLDENNNYTKRLQ